jgi:hypothetical protein
VLHDYSILGSIEAIHGHYYFNTMIALCYLSGS